MVAPAGLPHIYAPYPKQQQQPIERQSVDMAQQQQQQREREQLAAQRERDPPQPRALLNPGECSLFGQRM